MNENNAVTKEELKEILAEWAKEMRTETAAQFDDMKRNMATMRLELLDAIRTQGEAQDAKIEMASRRYEESHSRLLTGMDKVVKELDNHRVERLALSAAQNRLERQIQAIAKELENHRGERLALGAAQNRLERQIKAIAKHLGIKNVNGNDNGNRKSKRPDSAKKRKSK
jgi:hypothetical protein